MLNIKILGGGCANCKRLEQITRKVTEDNQIEAEFDHVTDYAEIMKFGVMSTPALVVDGKVLCSGRIPTEAEITGWLKAA
ncbi:MAG: thioredoxin family protein [Chloroflexi bacterium HGW-Chloroflexi-4]|jgi:small redox-active disulfide protein 2|nr:MAG: thioredoxin family protein [Chloroflexi bacterium HGW-Chloroflexi-4]